MCRCGNWSFTLCRFQTSFPDNIGVGTITDIFHELQVNTVDNTSGKADGNNGENLNVILLALAAPNNPTPTDATLTVAPP